MGRDKPQWFWLNFHMAGLIVRVALFTFLSVSSLQILCAGEGAKAGKPAVKAAEDYAIQLHRPNKPGDKFRMEAKGSQIERTETKEGAQEDEELNSFLFDFNGTITVLAVTHDGSVKKVAMEVEKFTLTEEDFTFEAFPKGTRLVGFFQGRDEIYQVILEGQQEGRPVPAGMELDALRSIVNLSREDSANDDVIFGSTQRRKLGASWDFNKTAALADFKRDGILLDANKTTGKTILAEAVKVGAIDCLLLKGEMDATDFQPPLPKEFRVEQTTMTARYTGKFPLDTRLPELETTMEAKMSFRAKTAPAKGQPQVQIASTRHSRKTTRIIPLTPQK